MAYLDRTIPLAIKTVTSGVYRGFNPVVSISSKALVSCLVIGLIAFPTGSENLLAVLKQVTLQLFGVTSTFWRPFPCCVSVWPCSRRRAGSCWDSPVTRPSTAPSHGWR